MNWDINLTGQFDAVIDAASWRAAGNVWVNDPANSN